MARLQEDLCASFCGEELINGSINRLMTLVNKHILMSTKKPSVDDNNDDRVKIMDGEHCSYFGLLMRFSSFVCSICQIYWSFPWHGSLILSFLVCSICQIWACKEAAITCFGGGFISTCFCCDENSTFWPNTKNVYLEFSVTRLLLSSADLWWLVVLT